MLKKIIEKIIIICAIITVGFIAFSNLFFTTKIVNDVSEQVNINQITVISLAISIIIIGVILLIRNVYKKNKTRY